MLCEILSSHYQWASRLPLDKMAENGKEKNYFTTVLAFIIPMMLVAPIAYKLTSVERAPLPLEELSKLHGEDPSVYDFTTNVHLVFLSTHQLPDQMYDEVSNIVRNIQASVGDNMKLEPRFVSRPEIEQHFANDDDEALDDALQQWVTGSDSAFSVFILFGESARARNSQEIVDGASPVVWTLGHHRHAWYRKLVSTCASLSQSPDLESLKGLLHLVTNSSHVGGQGEKMRRALAYRLSFALTNEDPAQSRRRWNFRNMQRDFLQPFLNKLSPLAHFTVESEEIQYGKLTPKEHRREISIEEMSPEGSTNATRAFSISAKELHQVVSSEGWPEPGLLEDREFIVRLTLFNAQPRYRPLFVEDKGVLSASFRIPGWGAVVFLNSEGKPSVAENARHVAEECERQPSGSQCPQSRASSSYLTEEEVTAASTSFVRHLRELLGIVPHAAVQQLLGPSVRVMWDQRSGVADWEIDRLVRIWTRRYLVDVISVLEATATLVRDMPQMTVLPRIGNFLSDAIWHYGQARAELNRGDKSIARALRHARLSMAAAEKAHYDPTMIPQLYFAEEHLYAVYLPLLAPLVLPIALAFVRELKMLLRQRRKSRENAKKEDPKKED